MKGKIEQLLKDAGVRYEFIPLPADLAPDVPTHMHFYGEGLEHALATMIYKTENGFVAVSRRGNTKLSSKKLREALGVKRLSLATEAEMQSLGLTPGLVPPLGHSMPVYMDKKLLSSGYFYDGTGHKLFGLKMGIDDLLKVNKAVVGDYTSGSEEVAVPDEKQGLVVTVDDLEKDKSQKKRRVFSATRATGRLHLGNYLGAVKGYLALQNDSRFECVFMVVDLHTITTPFDHKTLAAASKEIIIDYLACGLDPEKVVVTAQSLVPEHAYLAFLFSSVVTVARMQHLPTFKEKVKQHPDNVTMALLNYPVLMAADILVYKAGLVPVGVDQEPHLEVAREIARKMNDQFGTDFPEPIRFATKGEYVPSLLGEGKMSKSVEGSSIGLTDSLETIKKKLASAPTDTGKGDTIPDKGGVANILKFVELFEGVEKRKAYESKYLGEGIRYGDLKAELAEAIYKELKPVQEKRKYFEEHPEEVDRIIQEGAAKARKLASETVKEVKAKMGFI